MYQDEHDLVTFRQDKKAKNHAMLMQKFPENLAPLPTYLFPKSFPKNISYQNVAYYIVNAQQKKNKARRPERRGGEKKQKEKVKDAVSFYMVGHLFQNYDTIYVRFFVTYTCVLFPSI